MRKQDLCGRTTTGKTELARDVFSKNCDFPNGHLKACKYHLHALCSVFSQQANLDRMNTSSFIASLRMRKLTNVATTFFKALQWSVYARVIIANIMSCYEIIGKLLKKNTFSS